MFRRPSGVKVFELTVLLQARPAASLQSCRDGFRFYNSRVLDIKLIREKTDFVRQRLATRGAGDEAKIDELLKLDEQRRKFLAEVETLKSQRNRASKVIGAWIAQGEMDKADAEKIAVRAFG